MDNFIISEPMGLKNTATNTPEFRGEHIHAANVVKRQRNRRSRLDPHFNFIALLVASRSLKDCDEINKRMSLAEMVKKIEKQTQIKIHKSTLCRFFKRHPLLKLV